MDRPTPDAVQPPVTRWGVFWRLVGMACDQRARARRRSPTHWHGAWLGVDIVLGVVALVLVRWRRRWPLAVALADDAR